MIRQLVNTAKAKQLNYPIRIKMLISYSHFAYLFENGFLDHKHKSIKASRYKSDAFFILIKH
ncbi:hypothetical protein DFQ11_10469 [Winogradskyella epiphytica]|uniref:Uncharacterized protein n=1 Tax=Winogradskyella epiphytica TaxID=262005 RepID=A0A2V4XHJ8_9FLAO|nr:hypothetical protein DFQ11_10469 [Winogradskyella epiphytica]GGW67827.1 hypothetical protein GCM10008085_19650 [Winogradskyella epiphytica]